MADGAELYRVQMTVTLIRTYEHTRASDDRPDGPGRLIGQWFAYTHLYSADCATPHWLPAVR